MADEQNGGMIALIPRAEDAQTYAVDGGDDPTELHVTLAFLGDDVSGMTASQRNLLAAEVANVASHFGPIDARLFATATFNPDGFADRKPCAVYLVGGTGLLTALQQHFDQCCDEPQHEPYFPHMTAGFGLSADKLAKVGPVTFDRLRLEFPEQVYDFPFGAADGDVDDSGDGDGEDDGETKGKMPAGLAAHFAKKGPKKGAKGGPPQGATDGDTIKSIGDLAAAIKAFAKVPAADKAARKTVINAAAKRLKATNMLPKDWNAAAPEKKHAGLTEFEIKKAIEQKIMSPSPNAAKLREYWAHGKGAAKWRPGTPGDFKRLRRHLAKFVQDPHILDGLTANIHKLATGVWPGKNAHKALTISAEEFKAAMLMADPDSDIDSIDDDSLSTFLGSDDDSGADDDGSDDPNDEDDAYEQALVDDVDWTMVGAGELRRADDGPDGDDAENFEDDDVATPAVPGPRAEFSLWDD